MIKIDKKRVTTIKKLKKFVMGAVIALVVISLAGLLVVRLLTHQPTAHAEAVTNKYATATSSALFFPAQSRREEELPTIIFYPGAFVEPASYSIWSEELAKAGYPVYILKLPLNLAVLEGNAADKIITSKKLQEYYVGGHSLGGVMASRFASATHSSKMKGLFLLASYPDKKGRLDDRNLPVLSITATRDSVLDWDAYASAQKYLPLQTNYQVIKGGNHAGFGAYGNQRGDSAANISNAEQQEDIAEAVIEWLDQHQYYLNPSP